ncbi:reverse transcriptase [Phytophthora megakarya]|uniref:Reverse transcriptase n=1 Tax=Phytophthora megakarya TaxID=4795 RepID=A0A225VDJ4_9STRA|nr:reverse transcriptase [Phytophthora megakarya]
MKYKDAERNYSIREKELLANLLGLRLWRVYLVDKPFIVETNHRSLETIFTQKTISRRVARWYDELSEYPIRFRYIPGKENVVADGLSRHPDFFDKEPITLASLSTRSKFQQRVKQDIDNLVKEACLSAKKRGRHQIRNLERYNIDNKKIFYQSPSDELPRLVPPNIPEVIDGILHEFHDGKCYGHPGVERTLRLVEKNYYWRYMQ